MSDEPPRSPKDAHYARLRRAHRDAGRPGHPASERPKSTPGAPDGTVRLWGLHSVRAALANPCRRIRRLYVTRNALERLGLGDPAAQPFPVELVEPRAIDKLTEADAVHQGVLLEAEPLSPKPLAALGKTQLVLVLDQVSDPHNVGAVLRSAVAFGAGALITTSRHSAHESGVLAKAASGALEHIDLIEVRNLGQALESLNGAGFLTIGLDGGAGTTLAAALSGERLALVLGAEGKGLRQKTRETVDRLARLDLPGPIGSLNVSNAAAVALYAADAFLRGSRDPASGPAA